MSSALFIGNKCVRLRTFYLILISFFICTFSTFSFFFFYSCLILGYFLCYYKVSTPSIETGVLSFSLHISKFLWPYTKGTSGSSLPDPPIISATLCTHSLQAIKSESPTRLFAFLLYVAFPPVHHLQIHPRSSAYASIFFCALLFLAYPSTPDFFIWTNMKSLS